MYETESSTLWDRDQKSGPKTLTSLPSNFVNGQMLTINCVPESVSAENISDIFKHKLKKYLFNTAPNKLLSYFLPCYA